MVTFIAYALIEVAAVPADAPQLSKEQADAFCRAWNRKHTVSPLSIEEMCQLFSHMKDHGQHWLPVVAASEQLPDLLWLRHAHHCPDGSVFSDGLRRFVLKKLSACRQDTAAELLNLRRAWSQPSSAAQAAIPV